MKEIFGDLWEVHSDALIITTNGFVKNNGRAVMGRGCAREARDKYKDLDLILGEKIKKGGNHVHELIAQDEGPTGWFRTLFFSC
jgi:hypothetical protein